jgi:hypothetical protein
VRILALTFLLATVSTAAAEPPAFRVVERAALGIELRPEARVLSDKHEAAMASCTKAIEPTSGALFWLELDRAGKVTAVRVRGSGKPVVDTCLEQALRKTTAKDKLPGPIILAGHVELAVPGRDGYLPPPRHSTTAVLVAPHAATWQLTVTQLAYTANRAADLAQALDGVSAGIAACAPKRGATADSAQAIAWIDGKAIVRSGTPAYDDCVAKALDAIKLPTSESAAWMKLAITEPAEPLAPRTDKAGLSREQGLRDALTTAVRSRKAILLTCLDGRPTATLSKVGVTLAGTKATITRAATGNADADACVRKKFGEVAIPNAKSDDKLALEVTLERQ